MQPKQNVPAIVSLIAGIAALPAAILVNEFVALAVAVVAIVAGIRGLRRPNPGNLGIGLSIGGIVLGGIVGFFALAMIALLVTRPFR